MSPTDSPPFHGSRHSRRALLATLGTATLGGLAGCLDEVGRSADRDGPPPGGPLGSASPSDATDPSSETASDETRLRLTHVDPETVDAPVVVYSAQLRTWLREAATQDGPIRVHGSAPVYAPTPMLPELAAVELPAGDGDDGGDDARQTYAVEGEGGTRYQVLVGAESVESVPDDADPTPVADLSEARRDLVRRAISDQSRATVVPETRLGEWVRTEFFGGYVERDGTVYRGHEVRQTDAAFFSKEFWLIVSLAAVSESDAPQPVTRLAFPEIPEAVRSAVDPVLSETKQAKSVTTATVDDGGALLAFAESYDYLLTHTALFAVTGAE